MHSSFTYVWEFEVPASKDAEFRRHYGPQGTWVELFRKDPEYIETLLLSDLSVPGRYLSIDRWRSFSAYQSFRERFSQQYEELDKICGRLTIRETDVGSFQELSNGTAA
jgi:hypothetical protein